MDIIYRSVIGPDDPDEGWEQPKPSQELLRAGSVHGPDALPLRCDIIKEQDAAVPMRDGVRLYVDVFRPVGSERIPAIICWSPYGKELHRQPFQWYSPYHKLSNLQKFEALDPEYWVAKGYAIVNPDARGAFNSEGDTHCFGSGEGRDIYDLVEWLATQEWCNGNVAMAGNSWLAVTQWFGAAEQPPHLAAIAPWESFGDLYRDNMCRGGIPDNEFFNWSVSGFHSRNKVEDVSAMLDKYPFFNDYWQTKIPDYTKVSVPVYLAASWTNLLHVRGTFHAYTHIASQQKWLRVHNTHEWTDIYDYTEDLQRFFDCFLKGMSNGWLETPRVRLSVLDPGGSDVINRAEADFPIPRTLYQKLYLDAESGGLHLQPIETERAATYMADDETDVVSFVYTFQEDTELTGYFKAKLWMSAPEADDMDVFVYVQKLDANHNLLAPTVYGAPYSTKLGNPHMGAHGRLRASLRQVDPKQSTEAIPFHPYTMCSKLSPGEITPLEIGLWPMGMVFHAGEKLRLIVSGAPIQPGEFLFMSSLPKGWKNKGAHVVHTGGRYASYLQIPLVPVRE